MKKFKCEYCESELFELQHVETTTVDFSREGAIEGHPFLTPDQTKKESDK